MAKFLERSLKAALERNELFLVYQPFFELKTKKMIGMEALLRLCHPKLGVITPINFIPTIEQTKLINAIGIWVLKTACQQYAKWCKLGYSKYLLAINLSVNQLDQKQLFKKIAVILKKAGIPNKKIILELTETAIMRHEKEAKKMLERLSKMGINIAIDDFGTGYSSLSRLSKLPISILKIAKQLTNNIDCHRRDGIIIKSIIALAKSLNLKVLAEGIKTEKQRKFLLKNNCTCGQGYYFSKPLSAKGMTKFLATLK